MNAGIFFAVVLSGLPLFSVTFPATTNQNYAVVFTAGPGGGRVPQNISSRNTAVTVTDIPYGTQFTITYTGNTGYNGGSPKNGTVTADETVSHNAASLKTYTYTIESNSSNVNVRTAAVNAGWDEVSKLAVVVNSGIYVYGSSTSGYAMTISGTFKNGVTLTNNGYIVGRGGAGGKGGNASNSAGVTADGVAGGAGGTAINLESDCTIVNNGTIAGGGGGGGGGAAHRGSAKIGEKKVYSSTGGSGGGGGRVNGTAGAAGTGSNRNGNAGAAGSLTAAGDGGEGMSYSSNANSYGGKGGNGGAWGAAGGEGQKGGVSHNLGTAGAGGAKGKYIAGNSHATWSKTGTRIGGYS